MLPHHNPISPLWRAMVRFEKTTRRWIAGLGIIVTALVCLFAFERLAPLITLIVAVVAFAALIALFWIAGKSRDANPPSAK